MKYFWNYLMESFKGFCRATGKRLNVNAKQYILLKNLNIKTAMKC